MTALAEAAGCWCAWCLPDGERVVESGPHRFELADPAPTERYGLARDDSPYAWPWRCACRSGSGAIGASSPSSADAYWAWRRHAGLADWVPWRPLAW